MSVIISIIKNLSEILFEKTDKIELTAVKKFSLDLTKTIKKNMMESMSQKVLVQWME